MKRVLFVDDDQQVLDGLQNMLRKQRSVWEMSFVLDADRALDELGRQEVDVIVSDVRMPGMDGPTLLARVRDLYPTTARIVLSGLGERSDILRVVPVSHQYLSKPCDAGSLQNVIERACVLQSLLKNEEIRRVIGRIDRLPSVPRTYAELTRLAADPMSSIDEIARTIERDPAMAIKILHLSNSAYFGVAHPLTSIRQAVMYLGIEILRGLSLTAQVSALMEKDPVAGFSLERFHRSSLLTARLAQAFVKNRKLAEEAFTAGLVHDIGLLIVALAVPEKFSAIAQEVHATTRPLHVIEREHLGVSHAEIGAYLLGIWGLPLSIVETVAHHHEPGPVSVDGREVLAALHVADALVDVACHSGAADSGLEGIDMEFLVRTGCAAHLPEWRKLAQPLISSLAQGEH